LYQLFTGEERRIPYIFDDFHFCRSRVIGLDMTETISNVLVMEIGWTDVGSGDWFFFTYLPESKI
jgi:hypothetical protein